MNQKIHIFLPLQRGHPSSVGLQQFLRVINVFFSLQQFLRVINVFFPCVYCEDVCLVRGCTSITGIGNHSRKMRQTHSQTHTDTHTHTNTKHAWVFVCVHVVLYLKGNMLVPVYLWDSNDKQGPTVSVCVCVSEWLSVWLSVCVSVSVGPYLCLFQCVTVCLSVW